MSSYRPPPTKNPLMKNSKKKVLKVEPTDALSNGTVSLLVNVLRIFVIVLEGTIERC